MKIQSMSIVVPNNACINKCKFCVSRLNQHEYENLITGKKGRLIHSEDYQLRMQYARDNNCNNVMLTGTSEPQQNKRFLQQFATYNKNLTSPFKSIEMQTTGTLLDEHYLEMLRKDVRVTTISLSMSSIDDSINCAYNGTPLNLKVNLRSLASMIKQQGFNLRLSLNLTDYFNKYYDEDFYVQIDKLDILFDIFKNEFGADQITFRELYHNGEAKEQNEWIHNHSAHPQFIKNIKQYIIDKGKPLEDLEFGLKKYSINEMGTVIDNDCMSQESSDVYRYLILRPNCKLYSKWDDKGSLIF